MKQSAIEELGWLKVAFAVGAAFDGSLIAWLFQQPNGDSPALIILAVLVVVILTAVLALIVRRIYRCLELLRTDT